MYKKVLIPIDFSDDSLYIVHCLSNISHMEEVVLLHVTQSLYFVKENETVNPEVDYARLRLEELIKNIHMPRSRIRIVVEEIFGGIIADAIHAVAVREGSSLVIMGRRGKGIIETLLIGSTASHLLKYGKMNLLLIHPSGSEGNLTQTRLSCPDLFSRIMICTDFSKPDIEELCLSSIISNRSILLFHVISTGDDDKELKINQNKAFEKITRIKEKLTPYVKDIHVKIVVGDPSQEILRNSVHENVSMIVMKSIGDKGILQNLFGSTAEAVARTTKKPVLVIRQKEENVCLS